MATSKKRKQEYNEPEEMGSGSGKIDYSKTNDDGDRDIINDDDVIQKDARQVIGDTSVLTKPIPAAVHNEPVVDLNEGTIDEQDNVSGTSNNGGTTQAGSSQDNSYQQQQQQPKEEQAPFNSEFSDLPDDEQEASAAQMADLVIYGWSNLKLAIPTLLRISPKRIKKMAEAGEINLHERIRMSIYDPTTISLEEFIARYNATVDKPFVTSQEWKDQVRPLLIIVFKRKGIGFTTEQQLGVLFIIEIVGLTRATILGTKQTNEMIETLRENHRNFAPTTTGSPMTADLGKPQQQQEAPPVIVSEIVENSKRSKKNESKKAA